MNASCNNKSIFLFEKLSHFPFLDVHKHLNASSLFQSFLLSEKWETVIRQGGMRLESEWVVKITEDEVWIKLNFKNKRRNENFGLCFKEDPYRDLDSTGDVRIHQENNFVTFYHKTNQHLEDTCFKAFHLLNLLFPPASYRSIILSLGSRSPDFPFRLLCQLPRGKAEEVELQAAQEVDCADLVKFLRNVTVVEELNIRMRIKNLVQCKKIALSSNYIKISDARFLTTIKSIKQKRFCSSELGQNDFTSQDFNSFLQSWMENGRVCCPSKAIFDIREDQKITMEEVMKGLNPHVGLPRIRDRWFIEGDLELTAIDMTDGWDIKDSDGHIATVLLEPNRLTFVRWPYESWQNKVDNAEDLIAQLTLELKRLNKDREMIQKKADAGKTELFPHQQEFLEAYPRQAAIGEEHLANARDTKEKLLTVWKNDDETVYEPNVREVRPWRTRLILLFGSADIALDSIPRSMHYSRKRNRGRTCYRRIHGDLKIWIVPVTDIASINKHRMRTAEGIIYAYSDADSFDRISEMFTSLCEKFGQVFDTMRRENFSLLLHLPGSDPKDKDQPDQSDVESFQRNTWSDLFEFDPDSNSPIDSFVENAIQPVL